MIEATFPGEPFAKQRPKFVRRGNFVTTYTPKPTREAEDRIRASWGLLDHDMIEKGIPIKVYLTFMCGMPKSWSNKKREAMVGQFKVSRPDVDNYEKLVCDALNELAWHDDSQIVHIVSTKVYAREPMTMIRIEDASE